MRGWEAWWRCSRSYRVCPSATCPPSNIRLRRIHCRHKVELLFYASFVGFFRAMWLGYVHAMNVLIRNCRNIEEHTGTNHYLNYEPLENLMTDVMASIQAKNVNTVETLAAALPDLETRKLVQAMLRAVKQEYDGEFPVYGVPGVYYCMMVGSQLPVSARDRPARISTFTRKTIKGLSFLIEGANIAITIEEALEWAFVNRFTPYNNGGLINPF